MAGKRKGKATGKASKNQPGSGVSLRDVMNAVEGWCEYAGAASGFLTFRRRSSTPCSAL